MILGVPSDPGCVLNFLHDVNARQEQIRSDSHNPVSELVNRQKRFQIHRFTRQLR